VTFEEWWEENKDRLYMLGTSEIVRQAWKAAQQSERERMVTLIYDNPELFSEGGFAALIELVEINELEP